MISIKPIQGVAAEFMAKGIREVEALLDEAVAIKRFVSMTGGDAALGQGSTATYKTIPARAGIEQVTAMELASTGSIYELGDLHAQFRLQIYGAEGGAAGATAGAGDKQVPGRLSDLVIYRGRTYRVVGHPERIFEGGVYWWRATLRQGAA